MEYSAVDLGELLLQSRIEDTFILDYYQTVIQGEMPCLRVGCHQLASRLRSAFIDADKTFRAHFSICPKIEPRTVRRCLSVSVLACSFAWLCFPVARTFGERIFGPKARRRRSRSRSPVRASSGAGAGAGAGSAARLRLRSRSRSPLRESSSTAQGSAGLTADALPAAVAGLPRAAGAGAASADNARVFAELARA